MLKHSMKMSGMHGEKIGIDDDEKAEITFMERKKKDLCRGSNKS